MKTITKFLIPLVIGLAINISQAQVKDSDTIIRKNDTLVKMNPTDKQAKTESLEAQKERIVKEEKEALKKEIENINTRLDAGVISPEEAETLKVEAAKKRAANIENRTAIIDNQIALINRNTSGYDYNEDEDTFVIRIGGDDNDKFVFIGDKSKDKPRKYDRRTTEDIVFAIGFNNTLIDGQSLSDSPYKIGGSGFVELGYAWKTRIFDNTNFWRLKYGFSFQWNKLDIKDNQYFVNNNNDISLQQFPLNLDTAKFRTTNLVFPVHLEIGPSRKIVKDDYFRYSTRNKLKLGLGGYAGFNIGSIQKLKYKDGGDRFKEKQRGGFEVNNFVYGLSSYLAWGGVAVYVKYDLNPLFKNQAVDQNNISLGFRFDVD